MIFEAQSSDAKGKLYSVSEIMSKLKGKQLLPPPEAIGCKQILLLSPTFRAP